MMKRRTVKKIVAIGMSVMLAIVCLSSFGIGNNKFDAEGTGDKEGSEIEMITIPNQSLLNPYRLILKPNCKIEYQDLDNDGDPDVLKGITVNNIPVQWIDDDDDMSYSDKQGDLDNDCLMADLDKDGNYASYSDVVIDWVDNDNDGDADMQIYCEYGGIEAKDKPWGGNVMINIDLDDDNIMNYIDWNTFKLHCWQHYGHADFYEDYHGQTLFLKTHLSPEKLSDPKLNWENPFLFFDPDKDGLTEFAVRTCDNPYEINSEEEYMKTMKGIIDWVSVSYDLDNDNSPGNEFDFDMSISFRGQGFNYMDQVHKFPKMRGLPQSDVFFTDPRLRQTTELIYPGHDNALDMIFNHGKWQEVYFVYDEDDDCNRWERVEFYEPLDPYKTGMSNGGLDNGRQSDAVGDRGEWDMDNSGNGNIYISRFDGKIHLYGAESGYWRIDEDAFYFQGMGGVYDGYGPGRLSKQVENPFPVVRYSDTDNNGFFDVAEYNMDGDTIYEESYSLFDYEIDDRCEVITIGSMDYNSLKELEELVATSMWQQAMNVAKVAEETGINTDWYALLMHPKSLRQKYEMGYWLQFYLFHDLLLQANNNRKMKEQYIKAWLSSSWENLITTK